MRKLLALAPLLALAAGHAESGICVRATGEFVPAFIVTEPTAAEQSLAALEVSEEKRGELKRMAERIADAACTSDTVLSSSISIQAWFDATVVDIESFRLDAVMKSRPILLNVIKSFGSVPLRDGDPVMVRLYPVRIGGVKRPRVAALIKSKGEEPTFLICSDPACQPNAAAPKPRRPSTPARSSAVPSPSPAP